jgi:hypothetical protein
VADPDRDWRQTAVFWRADVASDVACFGPAPSRAGPTKTTSRLLGIADRQKVASDGLHLNWYSGEQAWLLPPVDPDAPIAAIAPLNGSLTRRLAAVDRLWRRIEGLPATPMPGLSLRRRAYLTRALRALCGRQKGATYREIAGAILGADAAAAGPAWKSSDARSLIVRLAATGSHLSKGGYRALLGKGSDFRSPCNRTP